MADAGCLMELAMRPDPAQPQRVDRGCEGGPGMSARGGLMSMYTALPFTSEGPSRARAQLRQFALELPDAARDDAELMVSELVTNALVHGRPVISLRLSLEPGLLTVSVGDGGQGSASAAWAGGSIRDDHGR